MRIMLRTQQFGRLPPERLHAFNRSSSYAARSLDHKMTIALTIAAASLVVSIVSAFIAILSWMRGKEVEADRNHYKSLSELYQSSDIGDIMSSHGIAESDLSQAGVSPEELRYILSNFTLAMMYHSSERKNRSSDSVFKPGSYRYNLCKSVKIQNISQILIDIMGDDTFTQRFRSTINHVKSHNLSSSHSNIGLHNSPLQADEGQEGSQPLRTRLRS